MPDALPRVAVLASGAGSTLRALIEAQHGGQLPVQFVGLFSDKPAAPALEHALRAGIPVCALSPKGYANRAAHDAALFARVADAQPDLVVCAGYMRIIEAASTRRFAGRMINLHPSLLPKHRGLHTHRAALDAGDLSHGASVHLVTAELDDGPILAQVHVGIRAEDDPAALEARVRSVERRLLIAVLAAWAKAELRCSPAPIQFGRNTLAAPLWMDHDGQLRTGEPKCVA